MMTREQENVLAENGDLQNELGLYKSVRVPMEKRPRTNTTRVTRVPLAASSLGNVDLNDVLQRDVAVS